MTYKEITGKSNQSIIEIALLEYGSIDGIYYIIEDNPTLNLTTYTYRPMRNLKLLIRNDAVINRRVSDHLTQNYPNVGNVFNYLIKNVNKLLPEIEDFGGQVTVTEYE